MNNIIKKDKSIGQILVKNDNDLQNAYQNEINFFNDYLGISEEEYNKLEVKSIKDKIDDSIFLTEVNNISSNIIFEDLNADDDKKINDIIKFSKKYDTRYNYDYIEGYKITNFETQKRFNNDLSKAKNKDTKLLFHGSETRNWLSILKNGLDKKYSGKSHKGDNLFGKGIYFTESVDKGLGYVDSGVFGQGNSQKKYVAIFDVHLGNVTTYKNIPNNDKGDVNGPYGSNKYGQIEIDKWILNTDYDSYYGASKHEPDPDPRYPLRRPEFVIYRNEQCTIKYIMEIEI